MGSAVEMSEWLDPVCVLYDAAFSEPPYLWPAGESERHRSMLERMALDPSFGIALASASDGAVVGFVYGIGLGSSRSWWEGFRIPVVEVFVREWPGRTVAIIDIAVTGRLRRRGVGRELMTTFLASRTEERATLAVQPQAEDSAAFYRGIGGWELVGRQDTPSPPMTSPEFDIYVRALPTRP